MPRGLGHRHLALDPHPVAGAAQHHRIVGDRHDPRSVRRHAADPGDLVAGGLEAAELLGEGEQEEVADRVARQLAGIEAALEQRGPHRAVDADRGEAAPDVARRRAPPTTPAAARWSRRRPRWTPRR